MSTETSQFTAPDPVLDKPADQFSSPHEEMVVENGRQLKTNPGFSKALEKATNKETKEGDAKASGEEKKVAPKKTGLFDKADAAAKAEKNEKQDKQAKNVDPIAKANAEDADKKENKKAEKGSRVDALLAKDEDEEEAPAAEEKKEEVKAEKTEDEEKHVTEEEIEQELKTPKSEKSERRFRELHRRWKAAEAKAADTPKQLKERDDKLAALETQMKEQSERLSKSTQADPDIQKKLDELDMYKRRDELESSDHVKTTFDARIQRQEENIYATLKAAKIKFIGKDETETAELIKQSGGFREFASQNPELVDKILDSLPVARRQEVSAAMMGQTMLEQEKKNYLLTESGKAKEYFENQRKEAAAAKANEVPPEKQREAQQQFIEKVKSETYQKYDFFNESPIPEDASADEKKRLTEDNKFSSNLREMFAKNLLQQNHQEVINVALEAALAHKFHRENVSMKKELKQLRSEIEKVRNGSRTATKGGAIPISNDSRPNKPAPSFGAAIERVQERRGSGL